MKRELLNIIVCPSCKSDLDLDITEQSDEEIVTGTLTCGGCHEIYPIENYIPNLLPPSLRE